MKCPLKFNGETEIINDIELKDTECQQDCAWWVIPLSTTKAGKCAICEMVEWLEWMKKLNKKILDSSIKGV